MKYNFSDKLKDLDGTATREIFKLLTRPEIVSFAGGLPASEFLPIDDIKSITNDLLSSNAKEILQYGTTEGFKDFRQTLIGYLNNSGISNLELDNTLVISGGQQGIDLALKCFVNPHDVVLVENPTYLAFLQILKSYEGRAVGVEADDEGLVLEDLEQKIKQHKPKMLYCVPTFSNPTGKTYSAQNRKKIAEITAKYNVIVIEDDPYSGLRYEGEAVSPLKAYDTTGNVIYVTSFSKVLSPGLRIGVAAGVSEIIRKMAIAKQGTDLHSSNLSQQIVNEYLKRGLLEPNIKKSLPIYNKRKNAMLDAIKQYMPDEFYYTKPRGGLFVWGGFKKDIDTGLYFGEAIENNVAYIKGSVFYANAQDGKNTLRLNFSSENIERIDEGIKSLGGLYKKILQKRGK